MPMHMHGQELQQFEKVNQLHKKLIPDAGGKFRLYDTSGALVGIAASKEAGAKLLPPQGASRETTMRGV